VTLCTQGYDLTAIDAELQNSFNEWLQKRNQSNSGSNQNNQTSLGSDQNNNTSHASDKNNNTSAASDKNNTTSSASDKNNKTSNASNKNNESDRNNQTNNETYQSVGNNGNNRNNSIKDKNSTQTQKSNIINGGGPRLKRNVETDQDLFKKFSQEVFRITDPDISIMDIIKAMTSPNPEASIKTAGVQSALSSCKSPTRGKRNARGELSFTPGVGYCPPETLSRSTSFCYTNRPLQYQSVDEAKEKCENELKGSLVDLSISIERDDLEELVTKGKLCSSQPNSKLRLNSNY
jgi:hypothetical protein